MTNSPTAPTRPRVCFVTLVLTRYRIPFHERVRRLLESDGIDYQLIYGAPVGDAASRADTGDLPWATRVGTRRLRVLGRELFWQPVLGLTRGADLTIASQENKLLANYVFQLRQVTGRQRFAFWGHGRNLQSARANSLSERLKRLLAIRAHWWFAYTPGTRRFLEHLGYPADRITVFNNAIDVSGLAAEVASITRDERQAFRAEHDLGAGPVGLYLGSIYPDKRLDLLIEAARLVHRSRPDFRLILAGAGPDTSTVEAAARDHDFIRYLGPRFGRDKAICADVADLMLLPAAVGLAVLDSFACGLPLITIAEQGHGPEVEYLKSGENGLMLPAAATAADYAAEVSRLIEDDADRDRLRAGAAASAADYSIDAMADAFCAGVRAALARA